MSREVDQRVVEMQFNNAQFERNTKQSLSTIEKLKAALKFDDVGDSFSGITKAAKNVNLEPVSDGANEVYYRFKALDVVAGTVLSNITAKAMTLGWTLTKALTIDPMKSGLAEYETQINSVQTILANTQKEGTNLAQVNAALDELNRYADMTIYNFTEMTRNIGTFTAAGVKLDTSVQAIKGIANLAAISGSTSQQASTAMYQLSQALAAGTVKLMDWNSVVNAGMGGQVFQDALKETARVHGVAIDEMIAKESSFRETLQHGWLTASILTETLAKFTGDLSEEELRAIGYTEEQIAAIIKMGETANDAATKVKTFTQLIDTLKEAVQSGWAQSWEYIIGDFEEAKELWTEISDRLQTVIGQSADARNALLQGALSSGWNQFINSGITDTAEVMQNVLLNIGKAAGVVSDEQIKAVGGFEESLKSGWVTSDMLQQSVNEIVDQGQELLKLSDSELESLGYSRSEIEKVTKSYKNLNEEIAKGNVNLNDFTERMSRVSGRDNLVDSIRNIFDSIGSVVSPIGEAFRDVFPSITVDRLYSFTESIKNFTSNLILSEDSALKLNRGFKGLFSILSVGGDIISTLYKGFIKILNGISPLGSSLLDIWAILGDLESGFASSVKSLDIFESVLDGVSFVANKVNVHVNSFAQSISNLADKTTIVINPLEFLYGLVKDFVEFITPGLEYFGLVASKSLGEFSNSAVDAFSSFDPTNLYNFINTGMGLGILTAIKNFIDSGKNILNGAGSFIDGIKGILDEVGKSIESWRTNKNSETLMTIAKVVGILAVSLIGLSLVNPERLTASIVATTVILAELIGAFQLFAKFDVGGMAKLPILGASLTLFSASVLILSGALAVISSIDSEKIVSSVIALGAVLAEFSIVAGILGSSVKRLTKGMSGLIVMSAAVRILASSVAVFSEIDSDDLIVGITGVGAVLLELAAFSIMVGKLKGHVGLLNGLSFNLLASSILVLSKSVETFGKMDLSVLEQGKDALASILLELGAFSLIASYSKGMISTSASMVVLAGAITMLINPISQFGSMPIEEIGKGLLVMGGALAEFAIAASLMKAGLGSAASIAIMATSMIPLANAFSILGSMDIWSIGKALISVAGALAIFGVAATVLAPLSPIIIGLSLSLAAFTAALGLLLVAASSAQLINNLAGSLSLLSTLNFSAFLQAIKNLAWMFVEFIQGIVKGVGEIASTLVTSIAQIITAVCEGIVSAAPAIGSAITTLVITLCEVIRNTAPEIAYTVVYLIGQVWEAIKSALTQLWSNITGWVDENIIHHDWFGIGAMINDFKSIWFGDSEEAGKQTAQGYVEGISSEEPSLLERIQSLGEKAAATWNRFWGIQSPSKLATEDGDYVIQGYIEGIQNGASEFLDAIYRLAFDANSVFCDFWGIHSPSDLAASNAENIALGMIQGMTNKAEAAKKAAEYLATHTLDGLYTDNYADSAYAAGLTLGLEYQRGLDDGTSGNELQNWLSKIFGKSDGDGDENGGDGKNKPTTKPTSPGSSTKKTPAELVEDKYKEQLEANKTLQEIADAEYELWMTENQNGADANEILAKKLEHTQSEIATQTSRVEIAQAKYDDMVKAVGADAEEAKEAYAALLEEKNTLAKLQADRYSDLYEEVLNRLSLESDRISAEYELWTESNPGASDAEKTSRKVENITDQLANSADQLAYAEKQYQTLFEQYGESDLRVMEAKNDLLEAQLDYQKKNNELWEAQLEEFDNMMNVIDRESQYFQSRTDMLAKIYDDGDLSSRSEDYINAVETYGKNSPEAMRAKYQGSVNGVLSVGVALRNMADQLRRTNVYQAKYNELVAEGSNATEEEIYQAQQNLLASQSAFLDFASDLADGFDMDEEAKSITMRLAYALSNNWSTVYGGFKKIWDQVAAKSPQLTQNLEKVFGDAFSEEGVEIGTSLVSTVTSALSGDTGGALASGLNTILSFLGSSMGQNLISTLGTAITNGLPEIGAILSSIFDGSILTAIGEGISTLVGTIGGGAGLAGVVETVGAALGSIGLAIPELLPIIAIIGAIIGAIALLIGNWDEIGEFFNNLIQGFIDVGKNIINGLIEGIKSAWNAFTDFIGGLFGGVVDFVKGIFGINSPSTEFIKIGSYIDEGFAKGIRDGASAVTSSMDDITSSAMDSALRVSDMVWNVLSNTDGFATEITPVVDFSTPKDTSNWYSSSVAGYGKDDSWSSRSSALASEVTVQKNQNGKEPVDSTRADVVAAIDALSNRVVMMGQSIENMQVVLDSKKLVGGISGQMDSALGVRAARARRGG